MANDKDDEVKHEMPERLKERLRQLVEEYITDAEDGEDTDVLINTTERDRIKDFALYLNNIN